MSDEAHPLLPPEVRDLLEQHRREVAALRDQGIKQSNEARRDSDLKVAALQQETERNVQALRDEANRAAAHVLGDTKRELHLRRAELIEMLAGLRDSAVRRARSDEADAIDRLIVQLETEPVGDVQAAPNNLEAYRSRIGESFLFSVTGNTAGPLWGTDVYTTDSSPAKAAVHAGVLRPGDAGVVRITIVERLPNYRGSTRNGVTSSPWHDPWHGAYRIEAAI
jgi:hypothetical protein